jgi:DNA-binding NtrC family response regulator
MIPNSNRIEERSPHILIVEDDAFLREAVAEFLKECGYPVPQAETADKALPVLREDERIGVVFSDVHMPGEFDGVSLAHWIARERSDVKVLLASGRAQPAAKHWRMFTKPYELEEVERAVRDLTNSKK